MVLRFGSQPSSGILWVLTLILVPIWDRRPKMVAKASRPARPKPKTLVKSKTGNPEHFVDSFRLNKGRRTRFRRPNCFIGKAPFLKNSRKFVLGKFGERGRPKLSETGDVGSVERGAGRGSAWGGGGTSLDARGERVKRRRTEKVPGFTAFGERLGFTF